MQTVGLRALTKHMATVMDRQNRTGAHLSVGGLCLPSFVHNLLPEAFMRVFLGSVPAHVDEEGVGDAGADRANNGKPGQGELKGAEVSVWREDREAKISRTLSWLASGSCHDDVYIFAVSREPCSIMMLKELQRGGVEWDIKQQRELLASGSRTYA
eukprot:1589283-Pyramimonas_sp.AAC.1